MPVSAENTTVFRVFPVWSLHLSGVVLRMRPRGSLIVSASILGLALSACRGMPAPEETVTTPRLEAAAPKEALPARTENDLDRTIRMQLNELFSNDAGLKNREISFTVDNGNVTLTGTVRNEAERERTNELAIHVAGVRSVANALRVSL